jgi:hypothetical protein
MGIDRETTDLVAMLEENGNRYCWVVYCNILQASY